MRQGYTPHEQQILDLTRQVGELRLALETATRERDERPTMADWSALLLEIAKLEPGEEMPEIPSDLETFDPWDVLRRRTPLLLAFEKGTRCPNCSRPATPADAPAFTHWTGSATRPDAPPAYAPRTVREVVGVVDAVHALIRGDVAPPADAAYRPSDADLWKRTTRVLDRASKALSSDVHVSVRPAVAKQCEELRGAILSRPLPMSPECTHDPSLVCLRCRDFDVTTASAPPSDAATKAVEAAREWLRHGRQWCQTCLEAADLLTRLVSTPAPTPVSFICSRCGRNGDYHGEPGGGRCGYCGGNGPVCPAPAPSEPEVKP